MIRPPTGGLPTRKRPSARERGTVLIDFDGVISSNSIPLTIDLLHRYIAARRPLSRKDVESFVRLAVPFSVSASLKYLFSGLGLQDHLEEFGAEFAALEASGKISVDKGFPLFVDWCSKSAIRLKAVTTAHPRRLGGLPLNPEDVIPTENGSKADTRTYERIRDALKCTGSRTLVIDDCPLALVAARKAGLRTVLMETPLYPEPYTRPYGRWIDFRVRNMNGFSRLCMRFFR